MKTRKRDLIARGQIRWRPTNRANLALDIVEPDVAFRRRIEFQDVEGSKSIGKGAPNIGGESVTDREAEPMGLLLWANGRRVQVPAKLADILKRRAIEAA